MNRSQALSVALRHDGGDLAVGVLERSAAGLIRFTFEPSYVRSGPERPTLSSGQKYPHDEDRTVAQLVSGPMTREGIEVHPWFSNLLPEGALREMVERGMPSGLTSDFDVLAHLGEDLPGAVVIRQLEGYEPGAGVPAIAPGSDGKAGGRLRFSLAGVQLKMSMVKKDQRLTFPASGTDGDIIVKLPSERYPRLPEIEYSSMLLARAAGVEIAPCVLRPASSVEEVDASLLPPGESVLCVERFDRKPGGGRVHMEDFAQIAGVPAQRKYSAANEETVLRMATRLGGGGTAPFLEGARRMACNILLGNTDAHVKNWSLVYPDRVTGRLSPAYDIVAVWLYDRSDSMALRFRGTHDSTLVGLDRFERAGEFCGVPAKAVRKSLLSAIRKAADLWPGLLPDLPLSRDQARALLERAQALALPASVGVTFRPSAGLSPENADRQSTAAPEEAGGHLPGDDPGRRMLRP